MAAEHVTALGAMSALRGQIEERLLSNDDFRAMRALDRAIAELQMPARAAVMPTTTTMLPSIPPMAPGLAAQGSLVDSQAMLHQKITTKFNGSAV